MTKKRTQSQQAPSRLRIIGGIWRSRIIEFPTIDGLRPTGNRVRETLFNWLSPYLAGARCLDAFAGSGALGFEALSRGARHVVFVEKDSKAVSFLQKNQHSLNATNSQIIHADCLDWLSSKQTLAFDIIFLDPPFDLHLHELALTTMTTHGFIDANTKLYLEFPSNSSISPPEGWQVIKEKRSAALHYQLLAKTQCP